MLQLKVYEGDKTTTQYFLEMYATEPIKLNLSVEDITNAEAKSVFSRTFRVPATRKNNQFFKTAFLVDGVDYDVTIKKTAEIIVDGAEFRTGHIRLQKIYVNESKDKIDYEVVFLGETRDFSSAIGDASMCQLTMTDLSHVKNASNIEDSWNTYPTQGYTSNDGLANGNVVYPLIDFGNTYDDTGNLKQARISLQQGQHMHNITEGPNTNVLKSAEVARFKPMIRAKRCLDAIFQNAGYQYESIFLDSEFFKQLYVTAFGNESQVYQRPDQGSVNTFNAFDASNDGVDTYLTIDEFITDPGGNYDAPTSTYTAAATGLHSFTAECFYAAEGGYAPPFDHIEGRLLLVDPSEYSGGTTGIWATGAYSNNDGIITVQGNIQLTIGDEVAVYCQTIGGPLEQAVTRNKSFECLVAPGEELPNRHFDCDYKQIDFLKDILTTFRLVMAPKRNDPNTFIIEPFVDYVGSGQLHDWSDKLMNEKDFVLEPLFFTQSDQIEFKHEEDDDLINKYHREAYKETYGYLNFDSGNELLKGKREIKTEWAPTPIARMEGAATNSPFIIPKIVVTESGELMTEYLPIKPKTRFLFYNGLQSTGGSGHSNHWYLEGSSGNTNNGSWDVYPLASYSSKWPLQADGIIMNWFNDVGYWGDGVSGFPTQGGQTIYNQYWGNYIDSLYNKFARRVTAYFTLNNVDLQDFSFDDVIFVNGAYYRPEKVIDAEIGMRGPVKVQLIKLFDYKPLSQSGDALTYNTTTAGPLCFQGTDGTITVTLTGTYTLPVSWSVSTNSGQAIATPFTIDDMLPGTYSLTVTDAQGRTLSQNITVPQSSATQLTATANITSPTDCDTADGQVTITPSGGTSPYSIAWDHSNSTSFSLTGLDSSEYRYTITDNNGCEFQQDIIVSCDILLPGNDIEYIREWEVGGLCQGESQGDFFDCVVVKVDSGNNENTDGYYVYDGDFQMMYDQYVTTPGQLGIVTMDQTNGCGDSDWYYATLQEGLQTALDNIADCYCQGFSYQFENPGSYQSTQNLVFVAQV